MTALKTIEPSEMAVQGAITPMSLIEVAMNQSDVDVDKMGKLWELNMKYEAEMARKSYVLAMAEFKKNLPKVTKDKINNQYNSRYAGIANMLETVVPVLAEYGITHSFDQDTQSTPISCTCILTHRDGHSESTTMFGNRDESGKKNDLQKIKSTNTYLRIATFESITGIVASDEGDDDGNQQSFEGDIVAAFQEASTKQVLRSIWASLTPDQQKQHRPDLDARLSEL